MPNTVANMQVAREELLGATKRDGSVVILYTVPWRIESLEDLLESGSGRVVAMDGAEQAAVGMAAGLSLCGKRPFVVSLASIASSRAYEPIKEDCAFPQANVKIIGVAGGVSLGACGEMYHSTQDLAVMCAMPNMRVYLPSDRFQTKRLLAELAKDDGPAYVRMGKDPVANLYAEIDCPFEMDRATVLREGSDVLLVAAGETVAAAYDAATLLEECDISATVLDMYCVKPIDREAVVRYARRVRLVASVEEHGPLGGLGSQVSQIVGEECPRRCVTLSLPDAPVVSGTSAEVFARNGLDAPGIAERIARLLDQESGGYRLTGGLGMAV